MRIISGKFRGKKITSFLTEATKPTSDRVKENIFNIISNYGPMVGTVVDPFAGSGNFTLECISRGATMCYANDIDQRAIKTINHNTNSINIANQIKISNYDYKTFFSKFILKTNYLFLDPPFALKESYFWTLNYMLANDLFAENAIIIIESDTFLNFNDYQNFTILKANNYGKVKIQILQYKTHNLKK